MLQHSHLAVIELSRASYRNSLSSRLFKLIFLYSGQFLSQQRFVRRGPFYPRLFFNALEDNAVRKQLIDFLGPL